MRSKTTKSLILSPNALETERAEKEHFEKFRERLSVIVLTSTPEGRRVHRHIKRERISCAKQAMAALIQRAPLGQPINAKILARDALALADTMVSVFVEERMFK